MISNDYISIGVAFNPYLPDSLFEEEILRLEKKLQSGLVKSIWIQFGTDHILLKSRMEMIKKIISKTIRNNFKVMFYGSILVPSKQFIARFKYRPWKGVYCSDEFLESIDIANELIIKLLKIYKEFEIYPIIETNTSTEVYLRNLKRLMFLSK